ncbi:MAG TPA: hypothetical protein VF691_20000 [Cytophagaceae bacterium]
MNSSEAAYIHDNPVRNGIVTNAEDYLYSSACHYKGKQRFVQVEIISSMYCKLNSSKSW